MLDRIVQFSTENRLLVVFFVLLTGALGIRAMRALPIDAVPDITTVQVQVLTNAPGLTPEQVERFITFPVEAEMSGLPLVEEIRSVSRFGLSAVTVVFEERTDIYFARQLVGERLSEARAAIPKAYGRPEMGPISTGLGEIVQFEVRGEPMCGDGSPDTDGCYTPMELREILDWYVAYQLRSVPGVVEVNSFGGELKTYEVEVKPERLAALGIGLGQIFRALEENNASAGGGTIVHGGEQRLIRGEGLLRNLDDIRNVVVTTGEAGTPIRIAELAEVRTAPMIRQGAVTRDGRGETVLGIAMMLLGENSRDVSHAVERRISELAPTLPEGVTLDIVYNRTELVDRTIGTVATNLIEGGVLVIVVLLLLLGSVRGGLLLASAIPLSMLAAFIGMRYTGISGNLMSLGAIDFGLIVDGSVVMVENIVRTISVRRARGAEVRRAVADASREVARPVVFAVGIIMVVYVPLFSLSGTEGKMFRPMAATVLFALAASLVLALTLMPAMATWVFRRGISERETWLQRKSKALYARALGTVMKARTPVVGAALALLAGAAAVAPTLGAEFIPKLEEGSIAMHAMRLPSVSLEESVRATSRIEAVLMERFPDEIRTVVTKTGRPEVATDPMGVELSDVIILFHPKSEWKRARHMDGMVAAIEAALEEEVPGQAYSFSQPIEMRMNELISGARSDVAIEVYGEDLATLDHVAGGIVRAVRGVPGAHDVSAEQVTGLPLLSVDVDRRALSRYGVSAKDVLDAVSSLAGHPAGEVFEGQRRFALRVRIEPSARQNIDDIRRLPIATPGRGTIALGELARLKTGEGPAQISRENVQRRTTVQANVRGRDLAGFVADARAAIAREVDIPPGYFVKWGGQFESLADATNSLIVAVPLALVFILLLLTMAYRALRPALLIYLNVPFAAVGGIFALALRGMPFSISAAVGFIALFGIAVLNGVVLVSTVRRFQAEGMDRAEATTKGALMRFRPVLMTALVASLGFLPMAVSTTAGAEVQRPLATVVIGGLITATLLTLFVLPVVYTWLGGRPVTTDPTRD